MQKSDFILAAKKTAHIYEVCRKIIEKRLSLPVPKYEECYVNPQDVYDYIQLRTIDCEEEVIERLGLPTTLEEIKMCLEGLCSSFTMREKNGRYIMIEATSIFAYNKAIRLALHENSLAPLDALYEAIKSAPNDCYSLFAISYNYPHAKIATTLT